MLRIPGYRHWDASASLLHHCSASPPWCLPTRGRRELGDFAAGGLIREDDAADRAASEVRGELPAGLSRRMGVGPFTRSTPGLPTVHALGLSSSGSDPVAPSSEQACVPAKT